MNRYHVNTQHARARSTHLTGSAMVELTDWLSEPMNLRMPPLDAYRAAHDHYARAAVLALGNNDLRGALRASEQSLEALRLAEREAEREARRARLGTVG
ncbi:hypothetical protein [Sanguibacter sp. HDW7]|uniref:hypothetical protein n=1 Tax=Sanguibacter sp. HDW7 TaxID=2714931 RepID=UPI00140DAED4|nr:hypothetical protein [Sanguibacter sp. HDW7]QIK83524.1 hypothetical protein G7063_07710 [Sanguibacter sp. HDW7]